MQFESTQNPAWHWIKLTPSWSYYATSLLRVKGNMFTYYANFMYVQFKPIIYVNTLTIIIKY